MRDANNYTVSKLIKISLYAQARQLPLLQAQSSVWNRLSFLNNFLMFLHKFNEIFRVNWWWISDCRASSIWKPYPWVKILKNMLNASLENLSTTIRNLYLESLGISEQTLNTLVGFCWWFLWIFTGVDSVCENLNISIKCRTHWDSTLCPNSTVASTFHPRQYLQSFEIPKQISCVLRGIKRAISRKLVKISDCPVSSCLKTVPGCWVSRHSDFFFFFSGAFGNELSSLPDRMF